MPSRIEELIAEFRKPHFDCKEDNHEHDCNCGAYLSCADELERAYREEVVPLVDALQKLRGYVARQRRGAESAIAEDAASAKYQTVRGTKRERQINFTKGASCAYEDILRHFPDLLRFSASAGTPAAKDESNGNLPRD